ncbi:MAG TPA: SprB repeat-containing protein, partial [Chitinophagales bacterium]|nr:SprB repeat-containing protein [Chitinophagales bacterium]
MEKALFLLKSRTFFSLVLIAFLIFPASRVSAQCGLSTYSAGSTLTPTTSFQTKTLGSGEYQDFNVTAGNIYSFYYGSGTASCTGYTWDMTLSSTSAAIPYDVSNTPINDSWTGGIACANTSRPGSAEWYATYTGTVRVNVKTYGASTCHDYVSCQGSATLYYKGCSPSADPGSGSNVWNVDAYATTSLSIPNTNARYGYYVDNISGLNFNTTNYWAATGNPTAASGWSGCSNLMPNENFVVRARRTGFPCGLYKIVVNNARYGIAVYLNGTQLLSQGCCITSATTAGSNSGYVLGPTDNIEIRLSAQCGDKSASVSLVPLTMPTLDPGSIGGIADGSSVCQGTAIGVFTNVTNASGGTFGQNNGGSLTYDWQLSTNGGTSFSSVGVSTNFWNSSTTVPPGSTYVIRRAVTDGCGTVAYSNTITVYGRPTPNGSMSPTSQVICPGSQASITLNFSPGTGPFDVTLTDGISTFNYTGVTNGQTIQVTPSTSSTYAFTSITDSYGCNRTSGFTGGAYVQVAPVLNVQSVDLTQVLCNGDSTGAIVVHTNGGGIQPVSYSIDNGTNYQSSNTFSNLLSGSYNVKVKDSLGCTATYAGNPINITQPTALNDSVSEVDASCASVFDGVLTVTAWGGVSPYTYSLNGGPVQSSNVFNGVQSGSYVVTIYDHNGCSDTTSVTVGYSYSITVDTVSTSAISCYGANDGSLTVQLNGGTPAFAYSINGVVFQSSGTFSGLAAGNYVVVGRDARGCTDYANVSIIQPGQMGVVVDSVSDVVCSGSSTGNIYISVTGGTPGYTYHWSDGATSQNDIGASSGYHTVTVTDSHGCMAVGSATLNAPSPLSLNVALYNTPYCHDDSTGFILITANGGVAPYSYVWNTGVTSQDIDSIPAGTYTVTVSDANNCQQTISQTLNNPTAISSSISSTDVNCFGGSDGTASVTVSGGTPPYSFQWSNFNVSQTLTGVMAGAYTVIITDHNGCTQRNSTTINQPSQLLINLAVSQISCPNANDGSITANATGGTGPYTYAWSNSETTPGITGLAGGTFGVTVTDSHGCSATASSVITNPTPIVPFVIVKNVLCYGDNNGGVNLSVTGGTPGYTFAWSNSETTEDLNNEPAGNYTVTITDSRGCTVTDSADIISPSALNTSGISSNITCNGLCNGAIYAASFGGTTPYHFAWSDGPNSADRDSLCAGNYILTVTDANGCINQTLFIISQPAPLSLSVSKTDVSCYGECNGTVTATASGGVHPYSYLWNNFAMTATQSGVCAGHYTVILSDSFHCQVSDTIDVVQPTQIIISGVVTNVSCSGFSNGGVVLTVTGGAGSYTYLWSNGQTTQNLTAVAGGSYSVTVTDGSGCQQSASFTINEAQGLHTTVSVSSPRCTGGSDGFIQVDVTGGLSPYAYAWSTVPVQSGATATNLNAGSYTLTVSDAGGCSATVT